MEHLARSQYTRFARIAEVGVLLAGESRLARLYELIIREAMSLTNAQAGAIYIRQGNTVLPAARRIEQGADVLSFEGFGAAAVPLSQESLCGEAILEGKTFNVADIRTLPEGAPTSLRPEFSGMKSDQLASLLAIPLKTPQSGHLGVLALLNARDYSGTVIPFDPDLQDLMSLVAQQAALALQNVRWTRELHQAYQDTLGRLALAAEYREDPSGAHIRRVGRYAVLIAAACGLSEEQVETIREAAPLHDIGKISIPEAVLLKPGRFTPEEFEQMKKHTLLGSLILGGSQTDVLKMAERIALTHHEKFDGTGYPYGQKGVEIPIEGRIMGLIDVFDALTTARPYKTPMPFAQAVEIVRQESGRHFDPACVQAFLQVQDQIKQILDESTLPAPAQAHAA